MGKKVSGGASREDVWKLRTRRIQGREIFERTAKEMFRKISPLVRSGMEMENYRMMMHYFHLTCKEMDKGEQRDMNFSAP